MTLLILVLLAATIFVGVPMLVTDMAEDDLVFTTVKSGEMKFIQKGESLHRIILNIVSTEEINGQTFVFRKKVSEDGQIVNDPFHKEPWLHKKLGVYEVGLPFYGRNVKEFDIQTGVKITLLENGKEDIKYLVKKVRSLWCEMNYTFEILNIELGDGSRVDLDLNIRLRATNPYRMVYVLHGNFFQHCLETLKSEVISRVKRFNTVEEFRAAEKGETNGFLVDFKDMNGPINQTLRAQAGLEMYGISAPGFETSDSEVKKATLLAEITALENAAAISKEEAKAKIRVIAAKAERAAMEEEGQGKAAQISAKINALKSAGAESHSILQVLITENLSQLQYLGGDAVSFLLNKAA